LFDYWKYPALKYERKGPALPAFRQQLFQNPMLFLSYAHQSNNIRFLLENLFKCVSKDGSFVFAELRPHCVRNFKMATQHRLMQIRKDLITKIQILIAASKEAAIRSVDHHRVLLYWHIGQKIFEEEQGAKDRADYGTYLLKFLAEALEPVYGSGFSRRQLELCRQFYRVFPIANTLYSQLSWSLYKLLIRIEGQEKREFYLAETVKNNWTVRQLERQINSQLFERLLLSKDVQDVLAVARAEKHPSVRRTLSKILWCLSSWT
jgi:hypothetical protein